MSLNPFKDSNLEDLQHDLQDFLSRNFGTIIENIKVYWDRFMTKGKERITIMLIPHSAKKIANFHIPIFTIAFIAGFIVLIITITSLIIINHTSTLKDVSKLEMYGVNSKIQIEKYRDEINRLYDIFQKLKPELTYLYSLTNSEDIDSLWAKGGGQFLSDAELQKEEKDSPPLEVLNMQEVEQELQTSKEVLGKIKKFLEARKKIIENTPSVWPVNGYIISKFGSTTSPYTLQREFQNGIRIAAFPGEQIKATAPGQVERVYWDPEKGLTVLIKHKYGFSTSYSHCQRVMVSEEQKISKGEVIATVGITGKSTRHNCFYQIKIGTEYVDPLPYLNKIR